MFSVRLYRIGPYAQRLYTLAPLKTVLRRDRRKNAIQKPNQTQPKTNDGEKERETTKINGKTNRNAEQKRVDETQKKKKHIVRELKNITNTKSERVHVNNTLRRLFVHSHRLHFYFACTLKYILYNSEWSSIQTIFLEKLKNNNVHSPSPMHTFLCPYFMDTWLVSSSYCWLHFVMWFHLLAVYLSCRFLLPTHNCSETVLFFILCRSIQRTCFHRRVQFNVKDKKTTLSLDIIANETQFDEMETKNGFNICSVRSLHVL